MRVSDKKSAFSAYKCGAGNRWVYAGQPCGWTALFHQSGFGCSEASDSKALGRAAAIDTDETNTAVRAAKQAQLAWAGRFARERGKRLAAAACAVKGDQELIA